jgi:hypothetical protein
MLDAYDYQCGTCGHDAHGDTCPDPTCICNAGAAALPTLEGDDKQGGWY